MSYTTIIGLEVHVQLLTQSKLFCGCANRFNPDRPNTQTCPVCLGLPGALPVLNAEAVRLSARTGLALNGTVAPFTKWDRKQYYYPDLPKAYQISQYDLPITSDGWLEIAPNENADSSEKRRIGIIRAHLEEDAGKNLHDESGRGGDSRVDLNRCGTPLLEIVSQPDLRTASEARRYLEELRLLLTYLGVSDCNMQEGSLRCDANVNLHIDADDGHRIATPIVEIKNLNSFRGVEAAIEYEAKRQFDAWQETRQTIDDVPKETRGWDADRNVTFAQRGKEEAADYRYFPDPDLLPVTFTPEEIEELRDALCEFPADRRARFETAYELSAYDAAVIIDQGLAFADYFETVATACGSGKTAANWVTQDVQRELNDRGLGIGEFAITTDVLAEILRRITANEISTKSGREIFAALLNESDAGQPIDPHRVAAIIEERGLALVTDTGELDAAIATVIGRNAAIVEDVRNGKQAAVGPLIGQVMKEIKGADPKTVREMLLKTIQNH